MQANILIFFSGVACGILVLTAAEAVSWIRVRVLIVVMWDAVVRNVTRIKEKIRARAK